MDLYKAIQELYAEKEKLERVIASLEELQRTAGELPEAPQPEVSTLIKLQSVSTLSRRHCVGQSVWEPTCATAGLHHHLAPH